MVLKVARFVNLILAALQAGNEFGTWTAVHRVLSEVVPERAVAGVRLEHAEEGSSRRESVE